MSLSPVQNDAIKCNFGDGIHIAGTEFGKMNERVVLEWSYSQGVKTILWPRSGSLHLTIDGNNLNLRPSGGGAYVTTQSFFFAYN